MIVAFNKNTSIRRGITLNVKGVISYIIICHERVKLNDHFAYTILQKGKLNLNCNHHFTEEMKRVQPPRLPCKVHNVFIDFYNNK